MSNERSNGPEETARRRRQRHAAGIDPARIEKRRGWRLWLAVRVLATLGAVAAGSTSAALAINGQLADAIIALACCAMLAGVACQE